MKNTVSRLLFLLLVLSICATGKSQADTLQIFILAGQSNMVGWGLAYDADIPGTLEHTLENDIDGTYEGFLDDQGDFVVRNDVWISTHSEPDFLEGPLTVGMGGNEDYIGPEYGFGFVVGDELEDDVLLIKTAWGGKSLAVDFRPPSSSGSTGSYYNLIVEQINDAVASIPDNFPLLADRPYKIAGFGWHQGWNDGEEQAYLDEYEENLINLIQDLRSDLETPNLPVVVANSGMGGFGSFPDLWINGLQDFLVPAQQAATDHPPFAGTTALVDTRSFWPTFEDSPSGDALHHWRDNAWTYLNIGREMGKAMIELLNQNVVNTNDLAPKAHIRLHPNPSSAYLFLDTKANITEAFLYNMNGQLISNPSIINNQIDITTLSAGVYLLQLSVDGQMVNKKVVKY